MAKELPETFRYRDARQQGLSEYLLRQLLTTHQIDEVARGLYRRADADPVVDLDLLEIAHRTPRATLCLVTALAHHGLTDQIPATIDIALPRGSRQPTVIPPVTWHSFALGTFDLGRDTLTIDGATAIGLYSPERSVIDIFRLRHREGTDIALDALKAWLRQPGNHPSALMKLAAHFPSVITPLRNTMEVLL